MRKLLALILISTQAYAYGGRGGSVSRGGSSGSSGFRISPDIMYLYNSQTGSNGAGVTYGRTLGELGFGYLFPDSPFYIGGAYSYDSSVYTGNSSEKDNYAAYGPTLGLITDGVFMLFTYYIWSQYDQTNSAGNSTTSFTSGSGFEVDLGYLFSVATNIQIGPELAYRSLSYTQMKNPNGTTGSASLTYATLVPYLAIHIIL